MNFICIVLIVEFGCGGKLKIMMMVFGEECFKEGIWKIVVEMDNLVIVEFDFGMDGLEMIDVEF